MFIFFFILGHFLTEIKSAQLIQRSNGLFITGRGCGTNTPLKYLNYLPEEEHYGDHECSFINLNTSEPLHEDVKGIVGTETNINTNICVFLFHLKSNLERNNRIHLSLTFVKCCARSRLVVFKFIKKKAQKI